MRTLRLLLPSILGPLAGCHPCDSGSSWRDQECVPLACDRSWSELSVGTLAVHVDGAAAPDGDGSAERPFTTLQQALDALPETGVVAVELGTYHENLVFSDGGPRVRVVGRCADGVVIDGSGGAEDASTLTLEDGADVLLEHLTVTGAPHVGVRVAAATLEADDVTITGNAFQNMNVAGGDVTLVDVALSAGVPVEGTGAGYGLVVLEGGRVDGTRVRVTGNSGVALGVADPDSALTLRDAEVSGTLSNDETNEPGYGALAFDGGALSLSNTTFDDNGGMTLELFRSGPRADPPSLVLEDVSILGTRPYTPAGGEVTSVALLVSDAGEVTANRVTIAGSQTGVWLEEADGPVSATLTDVTITTDEPAYMAVLARFGARIGATNLAVAGPWAYGVGAYGEGSVLSLTDATVRDVRQAGELGGAGILATAGAEVRMDGGVVEGIEGASLFADQSGVITAEGLTVRGTLAYAIEVAAEGGADHSAAAVIAGEEGEITLSGCTLEDNEGVGVLLATGARVTLEEGTTIQDTRASTTDRGADAIVVLAPDDRPTTLVARDTTVSGTEGLVVDVWGGEAQAVVDGCTFVDNLPAPVDADSAEAALLVSGGASVTITDTLISNQAGTGILVESKELFVEGDDETRSMVYAEGLSSTRRGPPARRCPPATASTSTAPARTRPARA